LPDPAIEGATQADIDALFDAAVASIVYRVDKFLALPLPHLSSQELEAALVSIGRS
jgi:hypothetical protein